MLKGLAVLTVLLVAFLPVVTVGTQSHPPDAKQEQPKGTLPPNQAPATTPGICINCVVESHAAQNKTDGTASKLTSYLCRLFSPEIFPSVILCLVGIATCAILMFQSAKLSVSADAAKDNAQAIINSERAWLTADVANFAEPAPKSNMIWIEVPITNCGKTPARIKKITAIPILIDVQPNSISDGPGALPADPNYGDSERTMNLAGFDLIIAPGQTHSDTHVFIWPIEWERMKRKHKTLYVYGLIEYMDTVKGDRHETGFCRIYAIPEPNFNEPTGFMFSPYIPKSYFRAT